MADIREEPGQSATVCAMAGRTNVNLQKLARRFRREAAASPKKAAVLALVAVVAIYYWTPLVWKWLPQGKSEQTATGAAVAAVPASPLPAGGLPATPEKSKAALPPTPWNLVLQWMERDPRTLAATMPALDRDPFVAPKPAKDPAPQKDDDAPKPPPMVSPKSLGLTLSGTILGPQRRVARINGRSYEQGQTFEVVKNGQAIEFTLAEVHPRRVVLTRNGASFDLTLSDPAQSGRIELSRGREPSPNP